MLTYCERRKKSWNGIFNRAVKTFSVATHLFRGIILNIRKSLRWGTSDSMKLSTWDYVKTVQWTAITGVAQGKVGPWLFWQLLPVTLDKIHSLARVGILGQLSGPRFDDFAPNCVRMEKLDSAKPPNLRTKRCPMIPTLKQYTP